MIPQHSYPPERSRCTHTPVRSKTSHKCMYIHHKVPILYEYRSRERGRMNPFYMPPPQGTLPRVRMLYPPGIATLIPDGSSPTTGGYESKTMLHRSCGAQCMSPHSPSRRVKAPPGDKRMQAFVGPPDSPQSFNSIHSNRKDRPFSCPPLWAIPKALMPLGRKQFLSNFFRVETHVKKLVSARMQRPVNNNKVPK